MKKALIIVIIVLVLVGAYLVLNSPWFLNGSGNKQSPSPSVSSTSAISCNLAPYDTMKVYDRPSDKSSVFGSITAQDNLTIAVQTVNGWLGFEPGTAQAANVGPFRYRWVQHNKTQDQLSGNCAALKIIEPLPPMTCFTMAQTDTPIYSSADTLSAVVATMHLNDYTEVVARKNIGGQQWVQVDASVGSLGLQSMGWVSPDFIDFNGSCDNPGAKQVSTFVSSDFGLTFQYNLHAPSGDVVKIDTAGNKIYIHIAKTPLSQSSSIELFKKDPNETFKDSIQKQILASIPSSKCQIVVNDVVKPSGTYSVAGLVYPLGGNPDECNAPYSKPNLNHFFLYDSNHPNKFIFIDIGTNGVDSPDQIPWANTILFKS